MCAQNGPSLCLGGKLCWGKELQVFSPFPVSMFTDHPTANKQYLVCWCASNGFCYYINVYTFVETVLDTLVLLPYFIEFFQDEGSHSSSPGDIAILFLAFVLNLAFALSLLCFIGMHASLVTRNTTSIEVHERRNLVSWKYDLGWRKNLEQVFGTKKLLWFLPLYSTEDLHNIGALHGLEFPTRSDAVV
ncbi:hypothetical protein E2562_013555 [Oryza meyeriana var. granulata]|uniref:Protein S-acyltransferase n=1 Tax=Oryza meyeriana var. granulata TaxID=110450 RepID=A0A6G1D255_9ORYZ|nr:hypothetical protein E2562_013555 [Oryza meyeriana var. granulata]KAF0906976.1 hypothetical protein E2562_013555 [Oryza meyeriana var. granulata]